MGEISKRDKEVQTSNYQINQRYSIGNIVNHIGITLYVTDSNYIMVSIL